MLIVVKESLEESFVNLHPLLKATLMSAAVMGFFVLITEFREKMLIFLLIGLFGLIMFACYFFIKDFIKIFRRKMKKKAKKK